jgi:hypothetical protein
MVELITSVPIRELTVGLPASPWPLTFDPALRPTLAPTAED